MYDTLEMPMLGFPEERIVPSTAAAMAGYYYSFYVCEPTPDTYAFVWKQNRQMDNGQYSLMLSPKYGTPVEQFGRDAKHGKGLVKYVDGLLFVKALIYDFAMKHGASYPNK